MSFVTKGELMFKKRAKNNRKVKGNYRNFDECRDFRFWSVNPCKRHQALLDEINGVQYEDDLQADSGFNSEVENPKKPTKNEQVNAQITKQTTKIEQVNAQISKQTEDNAQISQQSEDKKLISKLTEDNEKLIKLLRQCETEKMELSQIKNEVNNFRRSINIEDDCRKELQKMSQHYEARIEDLNNELESKENIMRALELQMLDLPQMERELEIIQTKYREEQLEIVKLREELSKYSHAGRKEIEMELTDLRKETELNRNLRDDLAKLEKTVEKTINQCEEEKQLLLLKTETMQVKFDFQSAAIQQQYAQAAAEEIEKWKKSSLEVQEKLRADLQRKEQDFENLLIQKISLEKDVEGLKNSRQKYAIEMKQLKARIQEIQDENKKYCENLKKINDEFKTLECDRNFLKKAFEEIQHEHNQELKMIQVNEEELKKMRKKIECLEKKLKKSGEEMVAQKESANKQMGVVKDREKTVNELETEMERLKKCNAELEKTINSWEMKEGTRKVSQVENIGKVLRSDESKGKCVNCLCKILEETTNVAPVADSGAIKLQDVLSSALVCGIESLSFNEMAQLHQAVQGALGKLLEKGTIEVKMEKPVSLSYLHSVNQPTKEKIVKNAEETEKVIRTFKKTLDNDVSRLEQNVNATKRRVDNLKEKIKKAPQSKAASVRR